MQVLTRLNAVNIQIHFMLWSVIESVITLTFHSHKRLRWPSDDTNHHSTFRPKSAGVTSLSKSNIVEILLLTKKKRNIIRLRSVLLWVASSFLFSHTWKCHAWHRLVKTHIKHTNEEFHATKDKTKYFHSKHSKGENRKCVWKCREKCVPLLFWFSADASAKKCATK